MNFFIHPTAFVSDNVQIGENTKIWHLAQVREGVKIGANCIIGKNVYIDFGVCIGDNVKIQNNCSVYHGVIIEDGVFVGPHVVLTNDRFPRAINVDGTPKGQDDWVVSNTYVKKGSSIGANATILPGLTIGEYAMIGAGSVVTKDVPDFALVFGNPARIHGKVGKDGNIQKDI